MLTIQQINKVLKVDDAYKQPAKLLSLMLDSTKRVETFEQFLEIEKDLSYEWFQQAFEDEHADRKNKKQDFTPQSLSELMARLLDDGTTYFESTAGNGGIMIQAWNRNKKQWFHAEELSDRSIPFLIFNMSIRGMHGAILHGDSLTREFKNVYFINNAKNDKYSDVIIMPKVDALAKQLDIRKWLDG